MSSVWTSQSLNRTIKESPTARPCRRRYELSIEEKRVKGIEPSCPAWEAGVLPLNYTRGGRVGDCRFAMADLQAANSLPGDDVVFRVCRSLGSGAAFLILA